MTSPYYATAIPHYDWIASYGRRTPDKLATVDLYSNRRRTYREFDNRIGRAALALRHGFGIGRGDRVAVLAPNSIDVFELQFACGRVGAILLPLNWRLTVHELAFIVGDATRKLLIFDRAYVEQARMSIAVFASAKQSAVSSLSMAKASSPIAFSSCSLPSSPNDGTTPWAAQNDIVAGFWGRLGGEPERCFGRGTLGALSCGSSG
jgi:acyl-CoA synthetase (AMP-forming)/AMP-acid ligase II